MKTSSDSSSDGEQIGYTKSIRKQRPNEMDKKKENTRNCLFYGKANWQPEHSCPARKSQCDKCKRTGHFANVCRSRTVNWIQEEETGSNTEPRQEINHIQSANSVNRIDVYKAILLVERQLM